MAAAEEVLKLGLSKGAEPADAIMSRLDKLRGRSVAVKLTRTGFAYRRVN
jgi:hypothetical protein